MDSRIISSNTFGAHARIHQGDIYYASDAKSPQNKIDDCRDALFLADSMVDRENLKSIKGQRTTGTCEWIRDNETYQSWFGDGSQCLWISGGPGRGKTMLSIFLTEELEKHTQKIEDAELLFYFCSQDEKHNSAVAVLRGLAYQLIRKRPSLANYVLSDFESPKITQETLKSPHALWEVLEKILRAPELGKVFCVLDGLDECDDASIRLLVDKFCKYFSKTSKSGGGRFKLAIISRKIARLDVFPQVRLDPDNNERVNGDIRHFIANSVHTLQRIRGFNNIRETVEATLLSRAQGTFLWVGFVMEELSKKTTCAEILETLDDVPLGLHAIYDRMLMQIEKSRRPIIFEILQWVTMAVYPLTLRELTAAIHLPSIAGISDKQVLRDYISQCGHILTVHNKEVGLIHQSARDYLLQEKLNSGLEPKEFHIIAEEAHVRLARTCLNYIEKSDFRYKRLDLHDISFWQKWPFLFYATMHWPIHARGSLYADKELDLSRPFFQKTSRVRINWWEAYTAANFRHAGQGYNPHLLHLASYLGIDSVVQKLLTTKEGWRSTLRKPVNQKGTEGEMPLSLAARGGHISTVQLLIANGADVNKKNKNGMSNTPLREAAFQGHEDVVRLLMANGAVGINDHDMLSSAAFFGQEAIMRLLLANGADGKDGKALRSAVGRGYEAIVQLLLTNGTDANTKIGLGKTVLWEAASHGNEAIVQLLLAYGADCKDGSALKAAEEGGHTAVVRLLLANGAGGEYQ
ncbi:hypothetical protein ACHAQJ_006630 [Trichoderma viride]